MRRALLIVVGLALACIEPAIAPGCSNSPSAIEATGGSGGTGAVSAAGGGGSVSCDPSTEDDCTPDPCAGVTCPAGQFCAYDGKCQPLPSCTGGDCSTCADRASCASCNAMAYASGWSAYQAVTTCVLCNACYTSCGGGAIPGWDGGLLCSGAPTGVDACDTGSCSACTTCATAFQGTCGAAWNACTANDDCNALLGTVPECPGGTPADAGAG